MEETNKDKIEYDLVPLTKEQLIGTQLDKDKVELDLINTKGKLEIQKFKVDKEIPKYELNESVEEIEKSLDKIEASKDKVDKDDPRYEEKMIMRDYDILCGQKELELAKAKVEKNMGARIANKVIKELENAIKIHEGNLKVFKDRLRNKVEKVPILQDRVQLDETKVDDTNESSK